MSDTKERDYQVMFKLQQAGEKEAKNLWNAAIDEAVKVSNECICFDGCPEAIKELKK